MIIERLTPGWDEIKDWLPVQSRTDSRTMFAALAFALAAGLPWSNAPFGISDVMAIRHYTEWWEMGIWSALAAKADDPWIREIGRRGDSRIGRVLPDATLLVERLVPDVLWETLSASMRTAWRPMRADDRNAVAGLAYHLLSDTEWSALPICFATPREIRTRAGEFAHVWRMVVATTTSDPWANLVATTLAASNEQ